MLLAAQASIAVATGARMLAEKTGRVLADEAFLAGMIHDIGITIEIQTRPQKFTELTELLSREQSLTFRQLEQQVLGATHESFGAALCPQGAPRGRTPAEIHGEKATKPIDSAPIWAKS